MTYEQVLKAIRLYRTVIQAHHEADFGVPAVPKQMDLKAPFSSGACNSTIPSHCLYMCEKIEEFMRSGDIGKAWRWYGSLQTLLWTMHYFSFDELGIHNKS